VQAFYRCLLRQSSASLDPREAVSKMKNARSCGRRLTAPEGQDLINETVTIALLETWIWE
jgi:hypothetical protein